MEAHIRHHLFRSAIVVLVLGSPTVGGAGEAILAEAGWCVVETASFRVMHRFDVALARTVAEAAERARIEVYHKWFGKVVANWSIPCEIRLHSSAAAYAQETGVSGALPGYSRVQEESGRVIGRRIDLNGALADVLGAVLPHEVTHIVLWSEFGRDGLARWAHEGIAVLNEPRERAELHLQNLPSHRDRGELFGMAELLRLQGYPERHRFGPFYAQSVALVELLVSRKNPVTFTSFLQDARRHGYAAALQRHYALSVAELEQQWHSHVRAYQGFAASGSLRN